MISLLLLLAYYYYYYFFFIIIQDTLSNGLKSRGGLDEQSSVGLPVDIAVDIFWWACRRCAASAMTRRSWTTTDRLDQLSQSAQLQDPLHHTNQWRLERNSVLSTTQPVLIYCRRNDWQLGLRRFCLSADSRQCISTCFHCRAIMRGLSCHAVSARVCLSVCLSRSYILSKRVLILSDFFTIG